MAAAGLGGEVCGYTFRGKQCMKRAAHYCEPRADRVVRFFTELLVHTKGPHKRKPFLLKDWGECRPFFGRGRRMIRRRLLRSPVRARQRPSENAVAREERAEALRPRV